MMVLAALLTIGCASQPRQELDILPVWISDSKLEDGSYNFVTCSHDDLDPDLAAQTAQGKCLAKAAQLRGVTLIVRGKTVQSLSGSDSGETAEMQPIQATVRCEFTDRFMQQLASGGFRIWLRCRAKKSEFAERRELELPAGGTKGTSSAAVQYKRASILVTSVPQAEKIIVAGDRGERVIDVETNPQSIELREGDTSFTLRLRKFKDAQFDLSNWGHGEVLNSKTIYMEQEF